MKGIVKPRWKDRERGKSNVDTSDLITQKEAAELRGVTQAAIGDLIKRGRLRTPEMFGKMLVCRSEVEGFERKRPGPKNKNRSRKVFNL